MRSSLPWGQLPEHLDPEDQKEEGSKPDSKKSSGGAKWVQLTQGQRGALLNNEGGLLPDPLLTGTSKGGSGPQGLGSPLRPYSCPWGNPSNLEVSSSRKPSQTTTQVLPAAWP